MPSKAVRRSASKCGSSSSSGNDLGQCLPAIREVTFRVGICAILALAWWRLAVSLLFAVTLFLSATLLFLVQPLIGKMILPLLGGTPAVWNSCMVFFQAALLAGYAYAHAAPKWLGPRRHMF